MKSAYDMSLPHAGTWILESGTGRRVVSTKFLIKLHATEQVVKTALHTNIHTGETVVSIILKIK